MTINLNSIIRQNTERDFNLFVYKLVELYSLEEVCVHIFKSKFINLSLLEKLYHSIVNNDTINNNLVLNNLFIKVVQHNIAKEIPEQEVYDLIKDINIEQFYNHSCELNYHHYKKSTCEFSMYSSFKMCLYHYLNDTHITYNSYVSEYFIKKNLSRDIYQNFKMNTLKILSGSNKTHYLEEMINENEPDENLNSLLNSDKNKHIIKKISINNTLLWDQINQDSKENIDMNYIFLNHFRKQELIIKASSIVYWEAIYKIYKWLIWCYWNPKSTFRKKKLASEWKSYKKHCEEYNMSIVR